MSDLYGRKKFFLAGQLIGLAITLMIYFSNIWWLITVSYALLGIDTSLKVQIGYNYMIELVARRRQVIVGCIYMVFESCVFFFTTIYFWKIGIGQSHILIVAIVLQIISLIAGILIPESPRFLH